MKKLFTSSISCHSACSLRSGADNIPMTIHQALVYVKKKKNEALPTQVWQKKKLFAVHKDTDKCALFRSTGQGSKYHYHKSEQNSSPVSFSI